MPLDVLEKWVLFERHGNAARFQYGPGEPFHFSGAGFGEIVMARQVQKAVDSQKRKFRRKRPSSLFRLPTRGIHGDCDIAEEIGVVLAEGEHIGRLIDRAVAEVKVLHKVIAGEQHAHLGLIGEIKRESRFP